MRRQVPAQCGSRIGFVLIHDLGSSPGSVDELAHELAHAQYIVLSPRLPDRSISGRVLDTRVWKAWHEAGDLALAEIRPTCDKVIVCGYGLGGLLALDLAAANPSKVHGVAVLSPFFWFRIPPVRRGVLALSCTSLAARVNKHLFVVLPGAIERGRLANRIMKQFKQVHQPTLIVQQRSESETTLTNAQHLQRHLSGPVQVTFLAAHQDECKDIAELEPLLRFAASIARPPETSEILEFPINRKSTSNAPDREGGRHG